MRVVVTGASGRLGLRVTARLSRDGHDVTRVTSPRASFGTPLDLTVSDAPGVLAAARPEVIVHLAGVMARGDAPDWTLNRRMTAAVTDAALTSGARVILASTAAVYGDQRVRPAREADVTDGLAGYGHSKLESEAVILGAPESVALRIFNIHGPGFDDSLVARLLTSSPETPVQLRGPDDFVRDYVHADEVARVISQLAGSPLPAPHLSLNVGSGIAVSNRRLLDLVGRVHHPSYVPVDGGPSYSVADMDATTTLLGFTPASLLPGERP